MISHVKTLITRNAAMTYLVKKFKEKFEKIEMQEKKKDSPSERNLTHKKGRSKATTKAREGQTSAAPITLLHFLRNYALALFDKFSPENTQ